MPDKGMRSLKVSVPLVLCTAVLVISFFTFFFSLNAAHHEVEQDAIDDVSQQMTEVRSLVESFSTGGDTGNARVVISESGASDENVAVLALVNGTGQVAGATAESLVGTEIGAIPDLDMETARHVQETGAGRTFVSRDGSFVYSYYPVVLGTPAGAREGTQQGLLFMRYDIRDLKGDTTQAIIQRMLMMIFFSVVLFLLIGIFLHFRVTKRTDHLVGVVQQLAGGDLSVRSGMSDDDELSTIGMAFDQMAEQMEQDRDNLRVSESRFRRIFENSMMGIALVRPSFVFETVNARFSSMIGYSEEELQNKTLADITHPDSAEDETDAIRRLFSGEIPVYRSKKRYVRKDGTDFAASVTISAQIDEAGAPTHVIVMIEDITMLESALEQITASEEELRANYEELAHIGDALKESERRYRNLYRYAQVGLFETSLKNATVVACNERYCELFGFSSIEEAIGRDVLGLYASPSERTRVSEILRRQGYIEDHLVRFQNRKTGRFFWAKFSARYNLEKDVAEGSIVDVTREIEAEERLRESEHRFRETVKLLDEGYYSCTLEGKVIEHNLAFNRILGYPPDHDMKGTMLPDFWQRPEERSKYLRELLGTGIIRNFTIDAWTADKRPIVVMANAHLVKNIAGQVLRIDGTFVDITELRHAEDALRDEKEFNRLLLDASPTYYVAIGLDGRTIMMNQALLDVLGYTQAEVAGTDYLTTFVPPDDRQNLARVFDEIIGKNKCNVNVNRILTRSGGARVVEWHGRPMQQEGTRPGFFVGVGIDITDRREAEDALVQSEQHLKKSQEVAHLGSWELDLVHDRLTWSDEVYRIFGLEPRAFGATYEAFLERVHPDDREAVNAAYLGSVAEAKDTFEIEHRVVRAGSGEVRFVHEKCDHIRDATGRIVRSVGIIHDITERRLAEEALRESEERFRALVEELPIGVVMTHRDESGEKILYVNRAFTEMTGYPADTVHSFAEWAPLAYPDPGNREQMVALALRMYDEAARTVTSSPQITRVTCQDGTVREIEFRYTDLKIFGFWTLNDMTVRRNAEREITRMNEELARQARILSILNRIITTSDRAKNRSDLIRQVLDDTMNMMDYDAGGIYLIDPSGETATIACSRNLPGEFVTRVGIVSLKKPPYDSLLVRGEPIVTNHYEQVSPEYSRKTGFLSVAAIPLYSMSGVLGSINVISRKRHTVSDEEKETLLSIGRELGNALGKIAAENSLRESEDKFRLVSENAPDAIIIQTTGQFAYLNPAACRLFGAQAPADLLEKPVVEHFHPDYQDLIRERIHQLNDTRQSVSRVEEKILRLDGATVDVEVSAVPVQFRGENGALVFLRDITERKYADEQREALIRELEKKNAELERFTYTVSHDLKSPLITIRGFTGLIEEDLQKGDISRIKKDLHRIAGAADTMQHLLVDLLALSRIGRIISAPEDVPFGTIAREAADLLAVPLTERQIRLKIDKEMPVVSVDRARIREVLVNLIENATKYMGEQKKPVIRLGVRYNEQAPVFFVQDNGMGIDPPYLERVFNLFEKLNPSIPGTGIGLPIVRRIIEVHGGKIWAESEGVGKGTTICFTLPLAGSGGDSDE